ncbi:hypothetical protein Poli38472_011226 [Pythium oligandrum]|uniref:Uncharacterized protein n=1 Tax=Pythium oligandrum TaxID=41045 RepID=A0A8K1FLX2_PYTOL|nr:hypothetical protein Poli38472_011226 [Pythium oligandrum]|eukprot:TMW67606.1 hypothetical protein Poli38472_011226 [Pythium oligandrum]
MSESDVAGIQEILAARNPFPLLRFSDSIPENARPEPKMVRVLVDHAWIQPITARLEDYKQQNEVNTPTVNKGDLYWLVYERPKSNAVEILVPGFGFCVMNLEDLEIVDPVDEMMPKVQPCVRELRMLMFHEDESEILGLLSLLKVAGPSLTRFWFFPKNWSVLDDVLVHAVVQHCPVLRHLSLVKTRISSLQLVVDAFEKYGRAWESLELSAATIHEGDDISVFTDALSNSNSQIAGGLYAFRLPLLLGACRWGGTFGTPAEVFHVFFAPREESKEPDTIQGLTSLVQLVGANLTGFANIMASSTALKDEQFQTIVLSCPKLVHLDLDNLDLISMQHLVDAFEQSACKWKTLHLSKVNVEDPTSIIAFAEALSNPRSRISRCLVEVKIFFGCIPADALAALGRMLELNTRLEWCLIGANCQIPEAVQSMLKAQQGKLISRKMPIRRKAAFLSLMKDSSFDREHAALPIRELDSHDREHIGICRRRGATNRKR